MKHDPVATAREFWGETPPDWIMALAQACGQQSQAKVAKRLNRSASLVSHVLRRSYPGDMDAFEDAVRGALMDNKLDCPALGEIGTHVCQDWRIKARVFVSVNSQRVTMFRACKACARNRKEGEADA